MKFFLAIISYVENIRFAILENYNPDDIGEHHLGVWASRPDIFERLIKKMKNYGLTSSFL